MKPSAPVGATLYLVRHAIAAERGPDWPDDAKRPLTHAGAARMREAVKGLRALGVEPKVVATSPFARAAQTAKLVADGIGSSPEIVVMPALAPGHPPAEVAEALAALPDLSSVALVGHEPDLGELAAWFTGAASPPPFKKGGVCCLELGTSPRRRGAVLVWMATPRMLRAMAR